MEPAIIAALVAGTVSIIGLLIQLRIAQQTRIAQREQAATTAEIQLAMQVTSDLRKLESETESVRILAWQSLALLDEIDGEGIKVNDPRIEKLVNSAEALASEADAFLSSWAKVKYEINDELSEYLRRLRHECRVPISALRAVSERMAQDIQTSSLSPITNRCLPDMRAHLELILPRLDQFGKGVSVARHQMRPSQQTAGRVEPD